MGDAVTTRPYRLGRRQEKLDADRARVLDAAREVFAAEGFQRATVDDVARRAGVGRKTVYNHFGSKFGLLDALCGDIEQRMGIPDWASEVLASTDLADAAGAFVRRSAEVWRDHGDVVRNIIGLALGDEEAAAILRLRDAGRRADVSRIVEHLGEAGALAPGWSVRSAVEALWMLTSFQAYDVLVTNGGLTHAQAVQRLSGLARALTLTSAADPTPSHARRPTRQKERIR